MALIQSNKRITFHCARHTFATNFLRFDGRIEVLQKIMGHSKIETTMIYVHMSKAEIVKQMETMDKNYSQTQTLSEANINYKSKVYD
jgi:site-specific recombinase XerD